MDDLSATLERAIQLAKQAIEWADEARTRRKDCQNLIKPRVERVAALLHEASARSADLFYRPALRVVVDTVRALDGAGVLLVRCRRGGHAAAAARVVSCVLPAAGSFRKTVCLLDTCVSDLTWILRLSAAASTEDNNVVMETPSIAQTDPFLFLVWMQIIVLQTGSLKDRADTTASVVACARHSDRYRRLVIQEDGVTALLRLVKEGDADAQENAALAIDLLVRHFFHP